MSPRFTGRAGIPPPPLFGLAPGGVYPAAAVTGGAVRSYRTVSPLPDWCFHKTRGLFSVALSLGSPPPAVSRHRIPVEPGLSSIPRTGRGTAAVRPSGDADMGRDGRRVKHTQPRGAIPLHLDSPSADRRGLRVSIQNSPSRRFRLAGSSTRRCCRNRYLSNPAPCWDRHQIASSTLAPGAWPRCAPRPPERRRHDKSAHRAAVVDRRSGTGRSRHGSAGRRRWRSARSSPAGAHSRKACRHRFVAGDFWRHRAAIGGRSGRDRRLYGTVSWAVGVRREHGNGSCHPGRGCRQRRPEMLI